MEDSEMEERQINGVRETSVPVWDSRLKDCGIDGPTFVKGLCSGVDACFAIMCKQMTAYTFGLFNPETDAEKDAIMKGLKLWANKHHNRVNQQMRLFEEGAARILKVPEGLVLPEQPVAVDGASNFNEIDEEEAALEEEIARVRRKLVEAQKANAVEEAKLMLLRQVIEEGRAEADKCIANFQVIKDVNDGISDLGSKAGALQSLVERSHKLLIPVKDPEPTLDATLPEDSGGGDLAEAFDVIHQLTAKAGPIL